MAIDNFITKGCIRGHLGEAIENINGALDLLRRGGGSTIDISNLELAKRFLSPIEARLERELETELAGQRGE